MITTITLNAAIDKAYVLKAENIPGSVMRMSECRYTPGGKGLNVARVLKALDEPVRASGLLGGHAGAWVSEALSAAGVENDFELVEGETRSCINIIEPDGRQSEILEPGFEVKPEALEAFIERFEALVEKSDVITISGSVPRGVGEDYYPRLVEVCKSHGKPVMLDTSGKLLIAGVKAAPTLIKPNADEICQLLGTKLNVKDTDAVAAAALRLREETGIEKVAVSLGRDGSVMACGEGLFRAHAPKIKAVSTVGCGDSMIAGFAYGIAHGWDDPQTMHFATAVAAANALELTTGFVTWENVSRLQEEIPPVEKLQ